MQKDLDSVKNDLKDVKSKVDDISPKMEILWNDEIAPAHSRRILNEYGEKVLRGSGIKDIIDKKRAELFKLVAEKGSKNIYDVEEDILTVAKQLPERYPEIVDMLKTGAFNTGADLNVVLYAGGIYLWDLILPDLGFPA
jgi:hypothetical protein